MIRRQGYGLKHYNILHKLGNENKLILKSSEKNAIIDCVSCVPETTTKSVTRNNIIHGFVENGMIDFDNNRFPYFKHILETFRKDPAVDEYKLCETHFLCLLQKYLDDGHVDDYTFEGNGSPVDVDEFGTSVRRTATISQESRQREKFSPMPINLSSVRNGQQISKLKFSARKTTICLSLKPEFQTTKTAKISFKN